MVLVGFLGGLRWSAPACYGTGKCFVGAASCLVHAAPLSSCSIIFRGYQESRLIHGHQDSTWVVLVHSAVTENCQLVAASGTRTWILQDKPLPPCVISKQTEKPNRGPIITSSRAVAWTAKATNVSEMTDDRNKRSNQVGLAVWWTEEYPWDPAPKRSQHFRTPLVFSI